MTAEHCGQCRALEYKIQVPSKFLFITTWRPMYKLILWQIVKWSFHKSPNLILVYLEGSVELSEVFTKRHTVMFLEYKVLPEATLHTVTHLVYVLYPTLICNLYMPGYSSITQSESLWISNYDVTPQYSRSWQKSILRQEIHRHTRGQKTKQNKTKKPDNSGLLVFKFLWKNINSRIQGLESFCTQN